jgi:hypothetical protein
MISYDRIRISEAYYVSRKKMYFCISFFIDPFLRPDANFGWGG